MYCLQILGALIKDILIIIKIVSIFSDKFLSKQQGKHEGLWV